MQKEEEIYDCQQWRRYCSAVLFLFSFTGGTTTNTAVHVFYRLSEMRIDRTKETNIEKKKLIRREYAQNSRVVSIV